MSPSDVAGGAGGGGEGFGVVIGSAASSNACAVGTGAAEEREIARLPYCYSAKKPPLETSWTMVWVNVMKE